MQKLLQSIAILRCEMLKITETDKPLKMEDLAKLAGVSVSTVSRALADSPLIPQERRHALQRLAAEAGYVVNPSARSLRLRKTETIAIVIPIAHEQGQLLTDPFFLEMFGHLTNAITTRNHQVLINRVTRTGEGWLSAIVRSQRQDGIVVIGQSDQHAALNQVASTYQPMVVWGAHLPDQAYCSVGTDNAGGARMAVNHLIAQGRRRIAFLGPRQLPEIAQRWDGYVQALRKAGLEPEESLALPARFTTETAYETARALLASGVHVDAVFAASDLIAMATIKAANASGLRVPEDLAVAGFDDIMLAAGTTPPLTTVRQDLGRAASSMVELLFRRMAGEDAPSATLAPELIIRAST
jgi:DNA-binding LacI/PurR family transcriptional regulator